MDKLKKETENGIRLSLLLVTEGTRTVKTKFQEKLAPNTLSSFLNQQNIKQKLDSFLTGKGKTPQLLNEVQYKLLYPQKGVPDAGKFDLTLLTFLFRNILYEKPPPSTNSWTVDPDESDTSLAADLVRLRKMRNSLYGHIPNMDLSDTEFECNWNKLAAVLVRIGCKQDDIDSVKHSSLSTTREIAQIQITTLIENDLADIQSILQILQISVVHNKVFLQSQCTEVQALCTELLEDDAVSEADWSFKTAKVLELLSLLPIDITKCILSNMNNSKDEILGDLKDIKSMQMVESERLTSHFELQNTQLKQIDETSNKTVNAVENLSENLASNDKLHTTMKRQVSVIQENVKQILTQERKLPDAHIIEIERYLKENQNALKILIYNKPDVLDQHSDIKNEFCFALGAVPWDVIIDLDHCSRTKGIFDLLADILKKKKDFKVVTYADSAKITEDDKNIIAKGLKTLWLLANGCEEAACPPSEKQFGACITEIFSLLKPIILRLTNIRSLFILNVIMSDTMKKPITRLFRALNDISESMTDRLNMDNSCAMSIYFDENHRHIVPDTDSDDGLRHVSSQLSPAQLLCLLCESFPSDNVENKFYFPGDKSMCYLTAQEMAKMQPYLELFHSSIGEISEDIENDKREDMIDNIKLNFLKGNELTAEAMFIHERVCQVYVARKEMDDIKRVVEKGLEEKQYKLTTEQRYVEVLHDASGSGTTTGVFLLYKLRERYPCIELKVIDNNAVSSLKKISKDSRKPLLVVVDSTAYRPSDLHSLQNRLENEMIKCLVVHIRRRNPSERVFDVSKEAASNGKCYISSKLESETDKMSFRKLYDTIRKSINADRVYLFGLIAFCDDYMRLNKHILQALENMTPCQKDAVTLVYLVRKLCHAKVEVILLRNLFDRAVKKGDISSLLGYGEDLLVFDAVGSVRPAHECLIQPYMEIAEKEHMRQTVMTNFMDNLYKMFSFSNTSMADSLRLSHELFIQRENPKEEFFSTLLESLGECCGKDYVKEQILRLIQLYSGISKEAHWRGLYARYLMHRMNKPDESIAQIKMAVGLQTTQSMNESKENGPLITTYAGLFRSYGHHIFKQMNLNSENTAVEALQDCLVYFEESINAFKLAQKITKRNYKDAKYAPIPFIGEAKARYAILNIIFHHICKRNHTSLQNFIRTSKNPLLHECEKQAMEALGNLEWLIHMDKIYDDQPSSTRQNITELKFKLLLLRYDEGITIHKLLKTIGPDVPCDIGMLVRSEASTLTIKNMSTIEKHWGDLDESQLNMVIEPIQKRLSKKSMLPNNYRDLLIAMIHMRQIKGPNKYRKYNIDLALNIANEWLSAFPDDGYALFHRGTILLVQGIEKKDVDIIKEATKILNDCDEFYQKHPSKRNLKAIKYAIGNGVGLGMLVPYHISKTSNDLKMFLGRQIGKKYISVRPFNGVLKAVLPDKFNSGYFKTDEDQQPVLKFSIYLRESFPTISTKPDIEVASPEEIAMWS